MKNFILSGASALALGACTQTPTPLPRVASQQAVASSAIISPVSYENPLAGYVYRGPVGPRDWRSVNKEQTGGH